MANEKKWDKIYLICALEVVVIQKNQYTFNNNGIFN